MSEADSNPEKNSLPKRENAFLRVGKYMGLRLVTIFLTVLVGVTLTTLIANMGGYVDRILMGEITENVTQTVNNNPAYRALQVEERKKIIDDQIAQKAEAMGLNQPFMLRTVRFVKNAMTLDLGRAIRMVSDRGSRQVRAIILERLPSTLVLFGTSALLLFFIELFIALVLSRRYGSFFDKLVIALAPSSAIPAWFYGLFLILIFAAALKILPFGGMIEPPVPDNPLDYAINLLRHMVLPLLALTFSQLFLNIYTWRTFFLIYSSEDYVEMAKAKGLNARDIERRYIMRPTLPTIVTAFSLTMISCWTGATVMETVFQWPGLGRAFYQAVQFYDTPVIVGNTVIFAYLLAVTVFILEFVYVILDPRVKVGQKGESV